MALRPECIQRTTLAPNRLPLAKDTQKTIPLSKMGFIVLFGSPDNARPGHQENDHRPYVKMNVCRATGNEEGDAPGKAGSAAAEEKPSEKTDENKTAGSRPTRARKT